MYELTLTRAERQAIDWIDGRYSNGRDLLKLLSVCAADGNADWSDEEWDGEGNMTFAIPENVAWEIADNASAEDGFWPCFAPDLAEKMQSFVDAIV